MRERLALLLSTPLAIIRKDPSELKQFYKDYLNDNFCTSCPDVIAQKYYNLSKINVDQVLKSNTNILKMIPGKLISTYNSVNLPQGHFTDKNITDKISIQLIQAGYAKFFINPQDIDKAIESLVETETKLVENQDIVSRETQQEKPVENKSMLEKIQSLFTKK
jgi:hypothetical protein